LTFLPWHEKPTRVEWSLFVTTQALDIWSTRKGLRYYPCVKESNPFLPKNPTTKDMLELKLLTLGWLWPTRDYLKKYDLVPVNTITGIAVINNLMVYERAKKKC